MRERFQGKARLRGCQRKFSLLREALLREALRREALRREANCANGGGMRVTAGGVLREAYCERRERRERREWAGESSSRSAIPVPRRAGFVAS